MLFKRKSTKTTIELDKSLMPKHVAIIMDGNGRWAKKKNMPVSFGHSQGVKRIEDVVKVAIDGGIESVSVYAFSTENWRRSSDEVDHLLKLIFKFYESKAKELYANGVKIKFPGSETNVPQNVLDLFAKMEEESKDFTNLTLNICFNYGARQELVDSVNKFIESNPGEPITEQAIGENLYDGLTNEIDLLIRTSGEQRLSNFMLWQLSYSEFVFTDVLWPDFDQESFKKCLEVYASRNRRFGGR
ncbi:polyprenyl diphosphate synthase [Mollicutes bacterium LVI A0078]|nr:polyprenyl diphosphate synthase [Mollicutes bacterium LVI A0075]WOO90975.1 polyprenyl diphosphate synthase [Mollicutes bacterium LVI A0078]